MKGGPCSACIFDTCHLFSLNVLSHFQGMCVSEKRAPSLGLITLTHFVVFPAARLQSQIAGSWICFNPVTQTWHMGRRWFSGPFFLPGYDSTHHPVWTTLSPGDSSSGSKSYVQLLHCSSSVRGNSLWYHRNLSKRFLSISPQTSARACKKPSIFCDLPKMIICRKVS